MNELNAERRETQSSRDQRSIRSFSISSLFIVTTIVALVLALWPVLGAFIVPLGVLGVLFFVGKAAIEAELPEPFWAAVIAIVFSPPLFAPISGSTIFEDEVVVASFVFGFCSYLLYYAIRRGHWATQVLAVAATLPHALFLFWAITLFVNLWLNYSRFWTQYLPW